MEAQKKRDNRIWGLYPISQDSPIPLKFLDIKATIVHSVAKVAFTQIYYHDSNYLVESEFFFPFSPDCCFDSFEASFAGVKMKGVIKEKKQAREEYLHGVQEGKTMAYTEINEETSDIMKILIGNIPPKCPISITYSYIQKLELNHNQQWNFKLFSTITSRFLPNVSDHLSKDLSILMEYPTIPSTNPEAYPWSIQVDIQSPYPITSIDCPHHLILVTYGNEKHTCSVRLNPEYLSYPNQDFELRYSNGKEEKNCYVMSPFEEGYCVMATFTADFNPKKPEIELAKEVKHFSDNDLPDLSSIRGEFIFLIDRSGSMKGQRITMAKNSLCLFLKSLPQDSFFNVMSFGTGNSWLHERSVPNSQETILDSIEKINEFTADMGGTEIYTALHRVFEFKLEQGYPRFVFLLTDGAVADTNKVLQLIEKNNHRARLFSVGIGNGCSAELITQSAFFGKGKAEFVVDNIEIYEKVISLLEASLKHCYFHLSLIADNFDAVIKSVSPNPSAVSCLLEDQSITFYLWVRNYAFKDDTKMTLKLRMYDTRIKDYRTLELILDTESAIDNDSNQKLLIHDMMRKLEVNKEELGTTNVMWLDKAEIKSALLESSLTYEILCKETAFLCEITEVYGVNNCQTKTSVRVPTITSVDYGLPEAPKKIAYKTITSKAGKHGSAKVFYQPIAFNPDVHVDLVEAEKPAPKASFLPVVMKQNFEGSWNGNDKELKEMILTENYRYKDLVVPEELESTDKTKELGEKVWITLLVLLWLEIKCGHDRNSWKLVYQKGCQWLKTIGVNFEELKHLGKIMIEN